MLPEYRIIWTHWKHQIALSIHYGFYLNVHSNLIQTASNWKEFRCSTNKQVVIHYIVKYHSAMKEEHPTKNKQQELPQLEKGHLQTNNIKSEPTCQYLQHNFKCCSGASLKMLRRFVKSEHLDTSCLSIHERSKSLHWLSFLLLIRILIVFHIRVLYMKLY